MFCFHVSTCHAAFFVHVIHVPLRTRGTKGIASGAAVISSSSLTSFQPCRMLTETLCGRAVPCDQFSILIDRHYGYDVRAESDVCKWLVTYTRSGTESRRFNSIQVELTNAEQRCVWFRESRLRWLSYRLWTEIHHYVASCNTSCYPIKDSDLVHYARYIN